MIKITLIILLWLGLGFLGHTNTFSYLQREYTLIAKERYHSQIRFSLSLILFGPVTLIATLVVFGFWKHGFKIK